MWFGYNSQTVFYHFFGKLNIAIFLALKIYYQSEWIVGTLCVHLLQFYFDCFETSQVFWTWSEDMHVVYDILWQTVCLVFNPIMVEGYAAHFSCTAVVQASDSMKALV